MLQRPWSEDTPIDRELSVGGTLDSLEKWSVPVIPDQLELVS